jgi:hypothetical protein
MVPYQMKFHTAQTALEVQIQQLEEMRGAILILKKH